MTPTENIRGNFLIRDIEERSILVETVNRAGESFQIRALHVEDLLLVKLDADRPKDREDIPLLAPHTSCEALLLRFNQMVGWYGNRDSIPSYAERFLEVLAEHFDAEPAKIIPLLNVTSGVKQMLVDTLEEGEDLFP